MKEATSIKCAVKVPRVESSDSTEDQENVSMQKTVMTKRASGEKWGSVVKNKRIRGFRCGIISPFVGSFGAKRADLIRFLTCHLP